MPKRLTVIDLCGIPLVNIQEGTPCMGSLSSLLLVSFSLHLSNFAAAIGIGMGGVDAKTRWKLALIFGFFEAAMPMVGLLIGQGLAGFIGALGHYVGAGLLVLTGMYTLWQAWRASKEQAPKAEDHQSMHFSRLTITGLALSIDNLVIGFALSFSHVPLLLAAGIIALVSVGVRNGERLKSLVECFQGAHPTDGIAKENREKIDDLVANVSPPCKTHTLIDLTENTMLTQIPGEQRNLAKPGRGRGRRRELWPG